MNFITIEKGNSLQREILKNLMLEYVAETDLHQNISTPKDIILKVTESMIAQIDENRFLKMAYDDKEAVGFCYAKIDRVGDKGEIRPDWGYIMELFVRTDYRRKGIGKEFVRICEQFFTDNDVDNVWLTADAVTGIPFWLACNYREVGETSKENNQSILIKSLNNNA